MFTKIDVTVKYRGRVVITGRKCTRTGLWMVPLQDTSSCDDNDTSTRNITNVNCTPPKKHTGHTHDIHTNNESFGKQKTTHQANSLIPTSTKAELARYYHQCMGSPPKSALLRTLRNHPKELETFPGLNKRLITKYLPPSKATAKGHMVRVRKGLNSTKSNRQDVIDAHAEVDGMEPQEQACAAFDNEILFCGYARR